MPIRIPAQRPSNRVLVLFGATGDLAKRKLFPGFFRLHCEGLMPRDFRIIGSGRHSPGRDGDFRAIVAQALSAHRRCAIAGSRNDLPSGLSFVTSPADDGSELASAVTAAEKQIGAEGER